MRLAETNRAACRQTNRQTGSVNIFVLFVDQAAVVAGRQTDRQSEDKDHERHKEKQTGIASIIVVINSLITVAIIAPIIVAILGSPL